MSCSSVSNWLGKSLSNQSLRWHSFACFHYKIAGRLCKNWRYWEGLQACDFSGYIATYPELSAFDMSAISPTDFITGMPRGMMMKLLAAQRSLQW